MRMAENRVDPLPPDAPELARRGPHPAGVRTVSLQGAAGRGMVVELWYPAVAGAPAGGTHDTMLRDGATRIVLRGAACRDAPPAPGEWPLVILSHGYPGNRHLMAHLGKALAGHGFLVASPDHPGSTYADHGAFGETLLHRMDDVRAVADGLQVFAVEGGSVAAASGLQAGDTIRSVNSHPTADLTGLAGAMKGIGERTLSVLRGAETVEIRLP